MATCNSYLLKTNYPSTIKFNVPMKSIKVTIKEYLQNGGVLENGREIFSGVNGSQCGEFCGMLENGMVSVKRANGTFAADPDFFAVQIEAQPIWK